jgi:hypothetical protein
MPLYSLDAERVYVMLHGSDTDASRFWGEDEGEYPIAMGLQNVPVRPGMVAFTGCCWGALISNTTAFHGQRGFGAARTPNDSIALAFLQNGARAFIGCTGSHYSPTQPPYEYFGGPMHRSFWRAYEGGSAPSAALLKAKEEYAGALPHGRMTNSLAEAIEFKILRQYTCLGLGW